MKYLKICLILIEFNVVTALAQGNVDSAGFRPLNQEAYKAVSAFFKYDQSIPLDGRVLERYETRSYSRDKIVFTGVRGDRVPGFLAIPKTGYPPYPLVLLFHISAGSKESWWSATSFERGLMVTDSLLNLNVAVLALDAQYHGERSGNSDFLPIEQMYFDQKWYYRYREGIIQTIGDYQRALDYVSENHNIDIQRVGVLGYSMGGAMSLIFASVDQRVKVAVAGSAALTDPWLYPISSVNIAQGVKVPTLLLAGNRDILISVEATKSLFSNLNTKVKELERYESGHRLPEENVSRSVNWLFKYLQKK